MRDTTIEETQSDQQEDGQAQSEERHQAGSRRIRIQAIEKFFSPVVVKNGSRQKSSIDTIRERARLLAMAIEDHVPEGDQKDHAVMHCAEAMFWANQAISHR
ncbi:MAG: hypothetical protein KAJ42_13565 [Gemmatimonadetes bacterium]|nr:hypothetical protein [Gemmatimonadota bacterium]